MKPNPKKTNARNGFQNLFLIGAMKCGTNTLYRKLEEVEAICTPSTKELDYFTKTSNKTVYENLFDHKPNTAVLLEGTTQYSKSKNFRWCPERIFAHNPNAKIVYLVRDPIERISIQLKHYLKHGHEVNFADLDNDPSFQTCISYSLYYNELSKYASVFSPQNIVVLTFEHFINHQHDTINELLDYFSIPSTGLTKNNLWKNRTATQAQQTTFSLDENQTEKIYMQLRSDISMFKLCFNVQHSYWQTYNSLETKIESTS